MSAATVLFLVIGGLGVLVLALGLLGVELFDLDGFVPLEAIAGALAMFGFGATIASVLIDARTTPALLASVGIGVATAIPGGWLALRLGRAAERMHTDATPARDDLVGLLGMVITPIPAQGYGQVRVALGGQPINLNATAGQPIPLGTEVFIINAPSETSVIVERVSTT